MDNMSTWNGLIQPLFYNRRFETVESFLPRVALGRSGIVIVVSTAPGSNSDRRGLHEAYAFQNRNCQRLAAGVFRSFISACCGCGRCQARDRKSVVEGKSV